MKKLIVIEGIFVLLMSLPAHSQLRLGVTGGLNFAGVIVSPEDGIDYSTYTGCQFGGLLEIHFSKKIGLIIRPKYIQKGCDLKSGNSKLTAKLVYFELPVLFKITFGKRNVKPYLIAGPHAGFLLNANFYSGGKKGMDVKDDIKSDDFGMSAGAGVSFPVAENSFFMELCYYFGLADINDNPDIPDTKITNKGMQFLGGFTIPLGRQE